MHEDTQRETDYWRGRADLRERFRAGNFAATTVILPHSFKAIPPYSMADSEANQAVIEADEELKNRGGIPPLPVTKVTLQKL